MSTPVPMYGFGGGGGAALNFKVVPGLTQPGTAAENTIWVKTEKIGVWRFSATQPEGMQERDVWFQTGKSSSAEFNALKKNGIQVYPIFAKQYISGELKDVEAQSYQDGVWVDWWRNGYIVADGKVWEEVGGFVKETFANGQTLKDPTISYDNEKITITGTHTSEGQRTAIRTQNMIDFSGWSKIKIDACGSWNSNRCYCVLHNGKTQGAGIFFSDSTGATRQEYEIDISGVDKAYISIGFNNIAAGTKSVYVYNLYLTK